jgi:small-conductance mechanosensitive channel
VRGQYSATAANAVDHTVERRVLLVEWIVWIHRVFLRGHLIGARLAVADRCGSRRQAIFEGRIRRSRSHYGGLDHSEQKPDVSDEEIRSMFRGLSH